MTETRPKNAGLKVFNNSGKMASINASGSGPCPVRTKALDKIGAGIRGHQDDGVLEVDIPAFAVLHLSLVEDLVENVLDPGWAFSISSSRITL